MIALSDSRYEFTKAAGLMATSDGFDGVASSNRRREPRAVLQSADDEASSQVRKKLVSTTRDLRQNFSIARWAINKHLDFVVSHNFRAKTGDKGFDRDLEEFVKYASHKSRYDSRGKHPRRRFMRLMEASRTVDGDVFGLKINGGRTQAIEGDRIRDPNYKNRVGKNWVHGVLKDSFGRAASYAVHKRNGSKFEFERRISASKIIPFGYFDRFDQDRGFSPLASAIKEFRDVYDGFDYALAREKVNQLWTFLITRESPESLWDSDEDGEGDSVNTAQDPYQVNFGSGPNVLDLDPGDDAKFITPYGTTDQTQKFWDTVISAALKAIDIPFSFYREDFTNFFGSRAALMLYLKS